MSSKQDKDFETVDNEVTVNTSKKDLETRKAASSTLLPAPASLKPANMKSAKKLAKTGRKPASLTPLPIPKPLLKDKSTSVTDLKSSHPGGNGDNRTMVVSNPYDEPAKSKMPFVIGGLLLAAAALAFVFIGKGDDSTDSSNEVVATNTTTAGDADGTQADIKVTSMDPKDNGVKDDSMNAGDMAKNNDVVDNTDTASQPNNPVQNEVAEATQKKNDDRKSDKKLTRRERAALALKEKKEKKEAQRLKEEAAQKALAAKNATAADKARIAQLEKAVQREKNEKAKLAAAQQAKDAAKAKTDTADIVDQKIYDKPATPAVAQNFDAMVSIKSLKANGALSNKVVQRAAGRSVGALRGCYKSLSSSQKKNAFQSVPVTFIIDERGRATNVKVGSTKLQGLSSCMAGPIKKIRSRLVPDVGTVTVAMNVNFNEMK